MIPERKLRDYAVITIENECLKDLGMFLQGFGLRKISDFEYVSQSTQVCLSLNSNKRKSSWNFIDVFGFHREDTYLTISTSDPGSGNNLCKLIQEAMYENKRKCYVMRYLQK